MQGFVYKPKLFVLFLLMFLIINLYSTATVKAIHGVTICGNNYDCGADDNVCPENFGADCSSNPDPDCCTIRCDSDDDCGTDGCVSGTYYDYSCTNPGTCDSSCTSTEKITDNDKDGYDTECDNDCDDNNADIHPGATETCNNIDDDCDGSIDEGLEPDDCEKTCKDLGYTWINKCCGDDNNENNPYESPETSCSDTHDNDCNGESDYDSSNDQHGDINCKVGVVSAEIVETSYCPGDTLTVKCGSTVARVNSIKLEMTDSSCSWQSWENNKAVFSCTVNSQAEGTLTATCSVDTDKSYAVSGQEQRTATITKGLCGCSSYTTQTTCQNAGCTWVQDYCKDGKYYAAAYPNGVCISGQPIYICYKDKCYAECDNTQGGCVKPDDVCEDSSLRKYTVTCDENCQCQVSSTLESCGTSYCDSTKHLQGSCENPCNSLDGDDQCGTCTLTCSCEPGWCDLNNDLSDGCETECSCTPGSTQQCPNQNGVCYGSTETCTQDRVWPGCDYTTINGYEATETRCSDNIDNDCDGLTDCNDPNCNNKPCNDNDLCTINDKCQAGVCSGTRKTGSVKYFVYEYPPM